MTQYNRIKLSNAQLNKLKSAIKNENEAVLRLSCNMIGNPNDETKLPHKLVLTNAQVANLQLILSYEQLNYLRWYNWKDFLVDLLVWSLTKTWIAFNKNVIQPLAALIPLGLTLAASAADAGIHKKNYRIRSSFRLYLAYNNIDNIKKRNGRHYVNSKISWRFWFIIK